MIIADYFRWHYTRGIKDLLAIARNYTIAHWHRFGISFHARTLFYPWRRQYVEEDKTGGILSRIGMWMITKIVDLYFRFVAAIVRSTVIAVGLFYVLATMIFFGAVVGGWILWPALALASLTKGVMLVAF